jgi:hypothetical protein
VFNVATGKLLSGGYATWHKSQLIQVNFPDKKDLFIMHFLDIMKCLKLALKLPFFRTEKVR